jgi:hypothetical protein
MRKLEMHLCGLIATFLSAVPATAQQSPTATARDYAREGKRIIFGAAVAPGIRSADLSSSSASPTPQFILESITNEGTSGRVRIGYLFPKSRVVDVTFSAPQAQGVMQAVDLQGLPQQFGLKFRAGQIPWKGVVSNTARGVSGSCAQESQGDLQRYLNCLGGRARIAGDFESQILAALRGNNPEIDIKWAWLYNVAYEVGRQSFTFSTTDVPKPSTELHAVHSVSGSAGILLGIQEAADKIEPKYTAVLTQQWQRGYKAGDAGVFCTVVIDGLSQCKDTTVDAPIPQTLNTTQIDLRWWISKSIGVGPRITRDFGQSITTYAAPLYYIHYVTKKDEEGKEVATPTFTGGVTAGWRDAGPKKGWFATVSVGSIVSFPKLNP